MNGNHKGLSDGKPILALLDLAHPEAARHLAKLAAAESSGQELHLAYVMAYTHQGYVSSLIPDELVKQAAEKAHRDLEALAADLDLALAPGLHVLRGGVGDQALLLARKIDAGLILLNAKRNDADHGLGPHAAQIMRYATCNVAVVR